MKSVGERLDLEFEVDYAEGGEKHRARFIDLLGDRTIVSVYMRNNTGTCDRQIDSLVESASAIEAAGATLIALSRDTCGSHLRYAAKKEVSFKLVSDKNDLFAKAADAVIEKKMYGKTYDGPSRSVFLLDGAGRILEVIEKIDAKHHGEEVLAMVRRQA
jgi:peroxiredoxin Q/BCP